MTMNNNVIGPIDQDTWNTMRFLHADIRFMKAHNDNDRYADAIHKEHKTYKEWKSSVPGVAA